MSIEEADIAAAIRAVGPRLYAFHACENHCGAPGSGHIPWAAVRRALADVAYAGPVVIESFNPENEGLANRMAIWRRLPPTRTPSTGYAPYGRRSYSDDGSPGRYGRDGQPAPLRTLGYLGLGGRAGCGPVASVGLASHRSTYPQPE